MRMRGVLVPALALVVAALLANLYVAVPQRGGEQDLATLVVEAEPEPDAAATPDAAPSPPPAGSPDPVAAGEEAVPLVPVAGSRRRASDAEWERRAVPVMSLAPDRAMVAIIIDDMVLDRVRANRVLALPGPLTLSFLPYGRDAPALAILARQRGHEILLHMPMQSVGGADPGPHALTVDLAAVEIRARVGAALDRFGDAIGLNNHMGSRFTAERRLLVPLVEELAARGLVFVDSRTVTNSQGALAAEEVGVPFAARDVFLDNDLSPEALRGQFEELERVARRRGHAVAIGHPHDATLAALAAWLPQVGERGIQIVPVSAIVRRMMDRATPRP